MLVGILVVTCIVKIFVSLDYINDYPEFNFRKRTISSKEGNWLQHCCRSMDKQWCKLCSTHVYFRFPPTCNRNLLM